MVFAALGDDLRGETDFLNAIYSDTRYAAPRISLAMIHYRRGELPRAHAALEEVLRVSPGHSEALHVRKLVNARILELAKARKLRKAPTPRDGGDTPFNFFNWLPGLQVES